MMTTLKGGHHARKTSSRIMLGTHGGFAGRSLGFGASNLFRISSFEFRISHSEASMREWILAELNHAFVRAQKWEVAVLPFGATEPHNLHMPYGTDVFQVEKIGQAACERAYRAGAKVILLPAIPFGVNTNFLKLSGTIACSLTPTTLLHILTDMADA